MASDFDQVFRVFHDGAAVPIRCYQAAIEADGALRGWFQPEPGYELEDSETISIWTPVLMEKTLSAAPGATATPAYELHKQFPTKLPVSSEC